MFDISTTPIKGVRFMSKVEFSEKEQEVFVNLICFLFEHQKILMDIYDKVTMNDTVYYVTKNQK